MEKNAKNTWHMNQQRKKLQNLSFHSCEVSHRHSGGISMRVHDDIWTDPCVTERHVLLWDDEATNT